MITFLILLIVGFLVGMVGALLGIGGGSIIIPVLVLYFKYPIHVAIATGLVTIIATSTSVVPSNTMRGIVNIKLGLTLELVTAMFAVVGGVISISLNEQIISIIFSCILIFTAIIFWKKKTSEDAVSLIRKYSKEDMTGRYDNCYFDDRMETHIYYKVEKLPVTMFISGFAGLLSGMLGIGGGIFKVPAMNIISKVPIKAATATSNFMVGMTATAGALVFLMSGYVDVKVCSMMILGVILGSKFAVIKFQKVSDARIKNIFIIFLLFIAAQMLFKGIL